MNRLVKRVLIHLKLFVVNATKGSIIEMLSFCRCAEPMPVPDVTGESPIGTMCFGCDLPMDEQSCAALYEDGGVAPEVEEVEW